VLPAAAAPAPATPIGTMPHDPELGIPEAVWIAMGPRAQVAAQQAGVLRRRLRGIKALSAVQAAMPASLARNDGVEVLREEGGNVAVGLFELPPLGDDVIAPPKSESAPCCLGGRHDDQRQRAQ
jgi:hypothetical protein